MGSLKPVLPHSQPSKSTELKVQLQVFAGLSYDAQRTKLLQELKYGLLKTTSEPFSIHFCKEFKTLSWPKLITQFSCYPPISSWANSWPLGGLWGLTSSLIIFLSDQLAMSPWQSWVTHTDYYSSFWMRHLNIFL